MQRTTTPSSLSSSTRPSGPKANLERLRVLRRQLLHRLAVERLTARVAARFVRAPAARTDACIDSALREIGQFARVDRSYVFLYSPDGALMSNTHEWCAAGINPEKDNLQSLPSAAFPWVEQRFRRRAYVSVPLVCELPPEAAAERDILQAQGIQSVVLVPLHSGERREGFIGFDSVKAPKVWPREDIRLLQIVAGIIGAAVARHRAQAALAASDARSRAMLAALPDLTFRMRLDGTYLECSMNDPGSLMAPPGELLGRRVSELLPSDVAALCEQKIRQALHTGKLQVFEYEINLPSGPQAFEARLVPCATDEVLAICRNITARRLSDRLRERHERQLQQLASELSTTQEGQRRELALLLHDGVGQLLALARHHLRRCQVDPAGCSNQSLRTAEQLLVEAIDGTQSLTFELSPAALYELGLAPALRGLARRTQQRTGLKVEVTHAGRQRRLGSQNEVLLFQCARELLTNVVKHAAASTARLAVAVSRGRACLTVSDDGRGCQPSAIEGPSHAAGGFGLFSIRQRIQLAGGSTRIQTSPGGGMVVTLCLPLNHPVEGKP